MNNTNKKKRTKTLKGEYTILKDRELGRGSYAVVYEGYRNKDQKTLAIKVISMAKLDKKLLSNLEIEIETMRNCKHENIIELYDVIRSKNHIYLVMENCKGGDLSNYIKRIGKGYLSEKHAKKILAEITRGLKYLNDHNIIHRDLKPQNILMTSVDEDAHAKIADFGFARKLEGLDLAQTICGSPLYMAPEILAFQPYDQKADLWSVGAILYEMLIGRPPYIANNIPELMAKYKQPLSYPSNCCSKEGLDVMKGLLQVDPNKRFDFDEFYNHPYVQMALAENPPLNPEYDDDELDKKYVMVDFREIDDFELASEYRKALSITTTDSGTINFPSMIFDFSDLKCRNEDRKTILQVEEKAKQAWAIAEFAMLLSKTYHKHLESIAVYNKSVELLYNTFQEAKTGVKSERMYAVLYWIRQRFVEFLDKAQEVANKSSSLLSQVSQKVNPELLLYNYGMKLAYDAGVDEYLDTTSNCILMYTRAKYIFEYLSSSDRIQPSDKQILVKYANLIEKRIKLLNDSANKL